MVRFSGRSTPVEVWNAFKLDKKDFDSFEERNLALIRGPYSNISPDLTPRLSYLSHWIGKVSDQRIAIWWAGQQGGVHRALIDNVSRQLTADTNKGVKYAWNTIFEINYFANRTKYDEYEFKARIKSLGWSGSLVREYINISAPYLTKGTLYRSLPNDNRGKLDARSLVRADVKYPEGLYDLSIPDEYLPKIISGFRFSIEKAVDMELDYAYWLDLCSIEADDDIDGQEYSRNYGLSGYVLHFVGLYKKLMKLDIKKARQEYKAWRKDSVFTRLRVWACGQDGITNEIEFMEEILSLQGKDFWSFKGGRDLLLSLKNKWGNLSEKNRILIEKKISKGPPKSRKSSQSEHASHSAFARLTRFHWLKEQGCVLSFDLEELTKELVEIVPEWKPEYATRAGESHGGRSGFVRTDTDWTSLQEVPLSEILSKAEKSGGRDSSFLIEYAPFSGLCDDAPLKAISALALELKSGSFSEKYWQTFLSRDKRKNDSLRLKSLIAGRMYQIPDDHFKELLLTASRWFETYGPSLRELRPVLFSKLWNKFITVIASNEESSGSALVRKQGQEVDWTMEAINSPSGNLAELHMTDPIKKGLKPKGGYPKTWLKKIDELLALPGDAHRYAMVIFSFNLNWFYTIDPKWTSDHLLKIIETEQSEIHDKEAVWAGFMWGANVPNSDLYMRLKPFFLAMASEKLSERKRHTEILSGLLLAGWGSKDSNKKRYISDEEFRNVLLNTTEGFRMQVLWQLERWSSDKKLRWHKQVTPFLKNVWPKHKKVRTAKASARLCDIALVQKDNFPEVSKLVVKLVSKITNEHFYLPELRGTGGDIASKYSKELLDLLYAVLPERPEKWPYGTQDVLKKIETSNPKLLSDLRLIELKSRLNDI